MSLATRVRAARAVRRAALLSRLREGELNVLPLLAVALALVVFALLALLAGVP